MKNQNLIFIDFLCKIYIIFIVLLKYKLLKKGVYMKILNDGSNSKGQGKTLKFNCSCGCIFQAFESEVIPLPRYGQHDELVGHDYYVRCPKCKNVNHIFE